ncbi:FIP1-like 1 protein [Aphelenchoides besseyi]|nr:FIP1-like 1 protein [Aphelenchoides besseyi]
MSSEAGFDFPAAALSSSGEPVAQNEEVVETTNGALESINGNVQINSDDGEAGPSGLNFLYDDESSDEETMITIGDIKQNLPFQKQSGTSTAAKLDLDGQPSVNGTVIYDLDLASMEEKPWQKPGADLTDYFNYGFNEDTWNLYCERQRKLRSEYGTQKDINRAILSGINVSFPIPQSGNQMIGNQSGRQLVNVVGPEKPQKVGSFMMDDLSRPQVIVDPFKSSPNVRTVITSNSNLQTLSQDNHSPAPSSGIEANIIPVLNFSKPPPNMLQPFDSSSTPPNGNAAHQSGDAPPGVEEIGTTPSVPQFDASVPPPSFNPNIPPPGLSMGQRTNLPPANMAVPPPLFAQQMPMYASAGFNQNPQFNSINHVPPLMGREFRRHDSSNDSDEEHSRRKRRRRSSRSISPRRRRDDKSRDYRERDRDRGSSRHERRRDDRDHKRGRDYRDFEDDKYDRKRRKQDRDSDRGSRRSPAPESEAPPGIDPE